MLRHYGSMCTPVGAHWSALCMLQMQRTCTSSCPRCSVMLLANSYVAVVNAAPQSWASQLSGTYRCSQYNTLSYLPIATCLRVTACGCRETAFDLFGACHHANKVRSYAINLVLLHNLLHGLVHRGHLTLTLPIGR